MSSQRFTRSLAAVVVGATIVAFLPTLGAGFVSWDDESNFLDNPFFRGLGPANLHWMWTTTLMGHYVPLSWMTLGADYVVWGMNPAGYHLTSILLHAANALLLYLISLRLLAEPGATTSALSPASRALAAAFAALLFSLHPLRVESVAWITERRDVLSCFFFFASLFAYLRYARRLEEPASSGRRAYAVSIALFVCSALSKATSMTLPAVLLVLNVYPLRRLGGTVGWRSPAARGVYADVAPFALVAVAAAATSLVALHAGAQLSLAGKIAVSAYSLVFYVWKTVLPRQLSPLYAMPRQVDPMSRRFLASYAILLVSAAVLVRVRRRWPAVVACVLLFVVTTLPMLGIVQNGPQIAADRYTYYSAAALSVLAAGWLFSMSALGLRNQVAIGAAVALGFGALTWRQTRVWHDSASLWTRVLSVDEGSSFAHVGMGRLAFAHGDLDGAILHYRRAVEIDPSYYEGYNNLGNALARTGRLDEAIEEYRRALAEHPAFPEAHNDLGTALAREGQLDAAIEQYREALAIRPAYVDAHVNLGDALDRIGDPKDAEQEYAIAARYRPDDADVKRNWGVVLAQEGRYSEAIVEFRQALELRPGDADIARYLQLALDRAARTPPR